MSAAEAQDATVFHLEAAAREEVDYIGGHAVPERLAWELLTRDLARRAQEAGVDPLDVALACRRILTRGLRRVGW